MALSQERRGFRTGFAHRTRHVRQHPRLAMAAVLGVAVYLLLPSWISVSTRLLSAFDVAVLFFLGAMWVMMGRATNANMRRRAQVEDEGREVVLALSSIVATAILLSISLELHGIKDYPKPLAAIHGALAGLTILLAWLFMNTMFALHYAQRYYDKPDAPGDGAADDGADDAPDDAADDPGQPIARGLCFPHTDQPDYWDFIYFSFVIGMTFQVSDVQIEDHSLRRLGLAHGLLAFFFNVVVLALTINIVAGLI